MPPLLSALPFSNPDDVTRHATPSSIACRRVAALSLVAGVLLLFGAGTASADFEKPFAWAFGSSPGCMSVNWRMESGSGVHHFTVTRESPHKAWDGANSVNPDQRNLDDCGLQPDTAYRYQVCAFFITTDGDSECSDWSDPNRTMQPERPSVSRRPPTPRIVDHQIGETWIGIKWEAGYDYHKYIVNISEIGPARNGPRTIYHNDDGTWGYQRVDGLLPSHNYMFTVQGCTQTFLGIGDDHCWDWSAPFRARTLAYPLHSGPDTCVPPFVWREAFVGDHVCVDAGRRTQVALDNAQASARREFNSDPKNGPFTGPATCKSGFVWREAGPSDLVCVPVEERSRVKAENASANERRAVPRNPGRPAPGDRRIIRPDSPPVVK